jgi:hypothetical protein
VQQERMKRKANRQRRDRAMMAEVQVWA